MDYIVNRLKSGAWVGFAGLASTVFLLVIENISSFDISDQSKAITVIVLTAIVSQITYYLNVDRREMTKK